jgi:hypothetical protein
LSGDLIIEPGGRLTSIRGGGGQGRGGSITVVADGRIHVQAVPGAPVGDFSMRGLISANSSADNTFNAGCGRTQITLVATGTGAAGPPPQPPPPGSDKQAIRIDGTVEIRYPGAEGVLGGIITLIAGGDLSTLGANPPFPSPDPIAGGYPAGTPGGPIVSPNPPLEPNATVFIGADGVVNASGKDLGGGEIRIEACFIVVEGLVQAGGDAVTGALGREERLPVIIFMQAHETLEVRNGGRVVGDVREGFMRHTGQPAGADNVYGTADDPLCVFTPPPPPLPINKTGKGGSDICLIARSDITIDGTDATLVANGLFAVSAKTISGSQKGGRVRVLSTKLIDNGATADIMLLGNAITTLANNGGIVSIQAGDNVDVNGVVLATSNTGFAGSGGRIEIQAVDGGIIGTFGGALNAAAFGPDGVITFTSCIAVIGFGPATADPAPVTDDDGSECGKPRVITLIPTKQPCVGFGCFCLNTFRVRGNVLTINGKEFGTAAKPRVTLVEFNPDCATDPGVGTEETLPPSPADPNYTQINTRITLTLPGGTSGMHIILSDPVNGPSSSCSKDLIP